MARPGNQGDDEDPTDAQIEGAEGTPSSQKGAVQVDLSEKAPKPELTAGKDGKSQATPPDSGADERRWKALESQVAATRRIAEELRKERDELRRERQAAPPAPVTSPLPAGTDQKTVDKYDKLVEEGRWQEAVDLKAELKAEEVYKRNRDLEKAQEKVQQVEQRRISALERSKQKVREAYPSLHEETGDETAPEYQLYNQAIQELSKEDEQFLHDPYAPELAMHRMEQLAKEQGVSLTRTAAKPAPARPAARGASMPASRGSGGANSYTLSVDQRAAADSMYPNMPEGERYKHYARFAKMAEQGGVEA